MKEIGSDGGVVMVIWRPTNTPHLVFFPPPIPMYVPLHVEQSILLVGELSNYVGMIRSK
jgi:hypothetical protein